MELIEDLFKLWWELFSSLSTFSKAFIVIVGVFIVLGALEREKKRKQEEKIREAKLGILKKEETDEEKANEHLLKP